MIDEKAKQTHKKNKSKISAKAVFLIVALSAVIVSAVLFALNYMNDPGRERTNESKQTVEATVPGQPDSVKKSTANYQKGFPVSFSSNNINDIATVGSSIFVLTDDTISKVSRAGKFDSPHVLNYAEPVLKSCGKYGMVYDRMTGKFEVFNSKRTLCTGQSESARQIMTAAVAENGNFAVASNGTDCASLLTYYDKHGNVIFSWACSKEHIVAIDIAPNEKDIVCAALNSENGEILTKLYLLNIYKNETLWEYSLNGSAAVDCFFSSSDKVVAVCTDKRVILDTRKENQEPRTYEYSSTALNCKSDENANTVVVTSKFGSFDSYEATLLSGNNKVEYVFETDEKIIDIACSGKRTYLLTESKIIKVGGPRSFSVVAELDNVELGLEVSNGDIYHYSLGYLFKN